MFFAIIAIPIIIVCQMGGFEGTAIEFKGLEAAKNEVFSWLPEAPAERLIYCFLVSSLGWGARIFWSAAYFIQIYGYQKP